MPSSIGTLREGPLHAALKEWVAQPGDRFEVDVDGFVADVLHGDEILEVQTGSFSALGRKLDRLLDERRVTVVVPLAYRNRIMKIGDGGEIVSERWSPKKEQRLSVFARLVSFPALVDHPNLGLRVLGTHQREIRTHHEGKAWRRKGWMVEERHLLEVVDDFTITGIADAFSLLPIFDEPFGTADLAAAAAIDRRLAQQVTYCLKHMGALVEVGRDGNAILYARTWTSGSRATALPPTRRQAGPSPTDGGTPRERL